MDIKDSYLHGTVGVVKSISFDADKLKYTLADVANTTKTLDLPTANLSLGGIVPQTNSDYRALVSSNGTPTWDYIPVSRKIYSSLTYSGAEPQESRWFTLCNVSDLDTHLFTLNTYAHADIIFTVTCDYTGGQITVLNTSVGGNSNYAYVKAIRILSNGKLQILLNIPKENTKTYVQVKAAAFHTSAGQIFASSLVMDDTESPTIWDLVNLNGKGSIIGHLGYFSKGLTLNTSSGDSPALTFLRGTEGDDLTDWRMYVTLGKFKVLNKINSTSWEDVLILHDSAGRKIETNYNLLPTVTNALDLGSSSMKWRNVHATTFNGNLDWAFITNKPTTLSGYGITNAVEWNANSYYNINQTSSYSTGDVRMVFSNKDGNCLGIGYAAELERVYLHNYVKSKSLDLKDNLYYGNTQIAYITTNFPSNQINALTGYSKATAIGSIAATDSLNTALGKLEYKADWACNWITSVTADDTDTLVNKWGEIVDFLDSVAEGTDITNEFVTRKTDLTITAYKHFKNRVRIAGSGTALYLDSTSSLNTIAFSIMKTDATEATRSFLVMRDDSVFKIANHNWNVEHLLLHEGNTNIKNGVITIAGQTITPITSHQSLANYVTLDTALTITGKKTFSKEVYLKFSDATLKFYETAGSYGASNGSETMCILTCFDQQDPKTSNYVTNYPLRTTLALQPRGGTVGIGTTTPKQTLEVVGNLQLTSKATSRTPKIVFEEYYGSTYDPWTSSIISDYWGKNVCTESGFTHGLYIKLGRNETFSNLNILDADENPIARISKVLGHWFDGTLTTTNTITSPKFVGPLYTGWAGSINTAGCAGSYLSWFNLEASSVQSDTIGFPCVNNANGILWLGTHSHDSDSTKIGYGHQLGFSGNGKIYHRHIQSGAFPTTNTWKLLAFITDIPTKLSLLTNDIGTNSQFKTTILPGKAGWYRIATSPIHEANCLGDFEVKCYISGYHTITKFITNISYATSTGITVLNTSQFSNNLGTISKVRILYASNYNNGYAYLEVYSLGRSCNLDISQISGQGWTLVDEVTETTSIPSGYTTKEVSLTNNTLTTTGDILTTEGLLQSSSSGKTIKIGSLNESFCHYETTAPYHYFNKPVRVNGNLIPNATLTFDLGSPDLSWNNVYATSFSGNLNLANAGTYYLGGMTQAAIMYDSYTALNSGKYHPILGVKTSNNHVFNLGAYVDHVGFYGYKSDRVDNGYDWSFTFNTLNGALAHSGTSITAKKFVKSGSSSEYVLLGNGDHKALSEITSSSDKLTSTNILTNLTFNGLTSATWTDTDYVFDTTETATYAIQLTSTNLIASGIMSVYNNLEDSVGDEIPLHVYGTAGWRPYLRTNAKKLLISCSDKTAVSGGRTVTIKIARIL